MTDKVFFRSESEVVVKKSAIPEPAPVKEIVVVQAAPDVEVMARDSQTNFGQFLKSVGVNTDAWTPPTGQP